jgi:hypothetical protein
MAKIMLRAEYAGHHHERPLGARHYTHALAINADGEVTFPRFTTNPASLLENQANLAAQGVDCAIVALTERTLPERSAKAVKAARRAGHTRQLRNQVKYAAWGLTRRIWSWDADQVARGLITAEEAEARQVKDEDAMVQRVVDAYRALRDHLADPTSGTD